MNKLMQKMKATGCIKSELMSDTDFFKDREPLVTGSPSLNIAFTGGLDGGMMTGVTVIAGPSRHFKSNLGLVALKSFLDQNPEGLCVFYDSEYGIPPDYLAEQGIDPERLLHCPVDYVEEMKFDIVQKLEEIKKGDKVFFFIDSLGNLPSKKEVDDATDAKSVADMTRAKAIKSLFRLITSAMTRRGLYCLVINHTYQTQEMYSKAVVGGGCLVAGTEILMFDGSLKEIQNVKKNDLVKTLEGPKLVTEIWNPETLLEGTPDCYEIQFDDGEKVICSDKHKFLTDKGWVEAKNLTGGEILVSLAV